MATYQGSIEITQGSQSITNNTSTVTYVFKIVTSGASTYGNAATSATITYSEGSTTKTETVSVGTYNFKNSPTLTIATRTVTVNHSADGSKSVSASLTWNHGNSVINNTTGGPITGSTSKALTTIARASSFGTITGNTIGSPITININRASSSFTHTLWYSFGKKTWQLINSNVSTSTSFTPNLNTFGAEIPNSTSGTLTLILRTYNGNTQIGNDVTKTLTIYMPSYTLELPTLSIQEAVTDVQNKVGVYVQNMSKLVIALTGSGKYGSTITKRTISADGVNYSSASITTGIIKGKGSLTIQGTITDSREKTVTVTQKITVLPYTTPHFTGTISASRKKEDGTKVDVVSSGSVSSLLNGTTEKNSLSLYVLYKQASNSYYPEISDEYLVDTEGLSYENLVHTLNDINIQKSYDIRLILKDIFNESTYDLAVSTEEILFDINREGIGVGKYREQGSLDVQGDSYMDDLKVDGSLRISDTIVGSNVPLAGSTLCGADTITTTADSSQGPSFLGTLKIGSSWYNILSLRHRNGAADGTSHGMILWAPLTTSGNIQWRQQTSDTWQNAKTLLDSSNYGSYALPLTGGSMTGAFRVTIDESELGKFRFANEWLGFYASHANAVSNTSRKGWLGYNTQNYFTIQDESGGGIWFYAKNSKYIGYTQPSGATYNALYPGADNADYLGMSGHRWRQLYAGTTTISTSDRNLKKDFTDFDERHIKFFKMLKPKLFRFKDGDSGRLHVGFISQDVEEALEACGLTALDFAGFCKDIKKRTIEGTHDEEIVYDENGNPEYIYSLRYEEFIALNTYMIQRQDEKINQLEKEVKRINELENQVQELKDLVLKLTKGG